MVKKYVIKGLVQGVGFRPFVAGLADQLNIDGWVRNTGGIVTVLAAHKDPKVLELFKERILSQVPTGGFITEILESEIDDAENTHTFVIKESDQDKEENLPLMPADIATCSRCQAEMKDKNNRRYRHPFISCTVCGPRYSILKELPYDRDTITMGDFDMCPECAAEYRKKGDIRRHAQTIACPHCGPKLTDTVENATEVIRQGGIVAIKDIGGYHLACDPLNEEAVAALRRLKHREAKAFAVMFANLDQIKEYANVNEAEARLLESPARPIVLVRQKKENKLAKNVCLKSPDIGAMLPCNPLQILLVEACGPLVMTSGNGSGDVLETNDKKMTQWMKERFSSQEMQGVKYCILGHNREILRPLDDSVMKVVAGRQQFLRRARGFVPNPVKINKEGQLLAAGGDLKASFCYVKNNLAYPSQYLGDLESISCQKFYKNELAAMREIFGFEPEKIAVDKHPAYYSKQLASITPKPVQTVEIQHHKAHVASVIAEHDLKGPVLGFAFDGTGFGDDGTIWGSEVFAWDGEKMDRVAHLKPVKLIGGDQGAKNCQSILAGFLHAAGLDEDGTKTPEENGQKDKKDVSSLAAEAMGANGNMIAKAIDAGINTITSTSMGRLFDAVSCLLGICDYNSYEGQAPIELENVAAKAKKVYPLIITTDGDTKQLFEALLAAKDQIPAEELALGFIYAVADFIVNQAESFGINQIALSGGTFNNRILLERAIKELENKGFSVFINEQLPAGDQNICLGQAFLL